MADAAPSAAKLFPVSRRQRYTLAFVYDWINRYGRVPKQAEMMELAGISRVNIEALINKGWIVKCDNSWWPLGVTRSLRFVYPATAIVKHHAYDLQIREVKEASDEEPCTMRRLYDMIRVAEQHWKMSPQDQATLEWSYQRIVLLESLLKIQRLLLKPVFTAMDDGAKGFHEVEFDFRWVRAMLARMQGRLTRDPKSILSTTEVEEDDETENPTDLEGPDPDGRLPVRPEANPGSETPIEVPVPEDPDRPER